MKVWKQLRKLLKSRDKRRGICYNIGLLLNNSALDTWYANQHSAYESWPNYSGDCNYPVPGDRPYCMVENKWKGKYGRLRKELLEHLIQYFKERNL